MLQLLVEQQANLLTIDTQLLENEVGHVLSFLYDALQQMYRFNGLLLGALRSVHRLLDGFLRLDGQFV